MFFFYLVSLLFILQNHRPEDVLALTPENVVSVVEFIVEEVKMVTSDDKTVDGTIVEESIRHRCALLMSCIGENELAMKHVIKHIDMSINSNRYQTSLDMSINSNSYQTSSNKSVFVSIIKQMSVKVVRILLLSAGFIC